MKLPRLAYVGDVPVEASYHGSALLYRLLRNYPPAALRIIETSLHDSQPARRLPGVEYATVRIGARRPLNSRWHRQVSSWYTLRAPSREAGIPAALGAMEPEAMLTVAHGYAWLAAARFARRRSLPLHLVIHDDWPRQADVIPAARRWLDARFAEVYRQAASRLCVSPYMERTYHRLYGVPGSVLLPSRAANAASFSAPPSRLREAGRPLVVGFGGTINTPGYVTALRRLASALARIGGQLNVYGPISQDQASLAGLDASNISLRGLVPSAEFIERMRTDVDVLFMPMSFDAIDLDNMRLSFPSKLTDYTAAGLPILAYGPAEASGIRWARENECARVVDVEDDAELDRALKDLSSPEYRVRFAEAALSRGEREFSHATAESLFFGHLAGKPQ